MNLRQKLEAALPMLKRLGSSLTAHYLLRANVRIGLTYKKAFLTLESADRSRLLAFRPLF